MVNESDYSADSVNKLLNVRYNILSSKVDALKTVVDEEKSQDIDFVNESRNVELNHLRSLKQDKSSSSSRQDIEDDDRSYHTANDRFNVEQDRRSVASSRQDIEDDDRSYHTANDRFNVEQDRRSVASSRQDIEDDDRSYHTANDRFNVEQDRRSVASSRQDIEDDKVSSNNNVPYVAEDKPWRLLRANNDFELAQQSLDSIIRSGRVYNAFYNNVHSFLEDSGIVLRQSILSLLEEAENGSLWDTKDCSVKEKDFIITVQKDVMPGLLRDAMKHISNHSLSQKMEELYKLLSDNNSEFDLIARKFAELSAANKEVVGNDNNVVQWILEENISCVINATNILHDITAISSAIELRDNSISRLVRSLSRVDQRNYDYFVNIVANPVLQDYQIQNDFASEIWNEICEFDDHGYRIASQESLNSDDNLSEHINSDDIINVSSGNLQIANEELEQEGNNDTLEEDMDLDVDQSNSDFVSKKFVDDYINDRPHLANMASSDEMQDRDVIVKDIEKEEDKSYSVKKEEDSNLDSNLKTANLDSGNIYINPAKTEKNSGIGNRK